MRSFSTTHLKIFEVTVTITSPTEIAAWLKHDYHRYLATDRPSKPNLTFRLFAKPGDRHRYVGLSAQSYHRDYLVYEKKDWRIIDFLGQALSIFNKKTKETEIYCRDLDHLYEIFYLAFESLVGEELEKNGFIRLHGLALEKNGRATILMLPPGGGKTTLAMKFLRHPAIKVLAEDILLFKQGKFYGLNFRWGVRESEIDKNFDQRLMKRQREHNKFLIDTKNLPLAEQATYGHLIVGTRQIGQDCQLKKVSKFKLFRQTFKPLVLGLELQQALAYFLLGNLGDYLFKSKLVFSRLIGLSRIIFHSKCYNIFLGDEVEKNFQALVAFLDQKPS